MASAKQSKKQTVIMLIGKTGNGKSSTGNTLLRDRIFVNAANATSVTKIIRQGVVELTNRTIKVIDTPGFEDTQFSDPEGLNIVMTAIENVITLCPEGIHACLIVLRYGSRVTREEKKTIRRVQEIFGETFMRKFCIILMTNGDHFYRENKNGQTIEQWAAKQDGEFQELYKDCEGKIILFDNNKTDDERDDQIQKLLMKVDMLGGRIYTDKHFEKARKTRKEMMVKAALPSIRDQTMTEVTKIFQELIEIYKLEITEFNEDELNKLKYRAENLRKKNIEQDENTGVLNELMNHVISLEANIGEEIRFRTRMKLEAAKTEKIMLQNEQERQRLIKLIEEQHRELVKLHEKERKCIVM